MNRDKRSAVRIGIGGPVGAGKTSLTAAVVKELRDRFSVGVITNDIYTKEDAEALMRMQVLPEERLIGVETGGCPHTAIREDASINLAAVDELQRRIEDLDLIFIESGGDNLSATFSPELADITVYMIDVAMGADIPRKRGPAMMKSDILLVNKTDLAPYVDVDLVSMESDLKVAREDRPYFLIQAKNNLNIEKVSQAITDLAGL
jgi:urease accessory protein